VLIAAQRARRSCKLCEEVADERDPLGERRRAPVDANAIGAREANSAVLLHEKDQFARVERRVLDELQGRALRSRIDFRDAERTRDEAEAIAKW